MCSRHSTTVSDQGYAAREDHRGTDGDQIAKEHVDTLLRVVGKRSGLKSRYDMHPEC